MPNVFFVCYHTDGPIHNVSSVDMVQFVMACHL